MSRLAEYRALERKLASQMAELNSLKNDEGLKREIEFESKLRELLGAYGYSLRNVLAILDPDLAFTRASSTTQPDRKRRARRVKEYQNPHNGEVVATKGGNHAVLKQWKAAYGADEVETWVR